jgi:hypothetical protein
LAEIGRAVPIKVVTGSHFCPEPVYDPVTGPHDFVVAHPGDNVMAPLPFPPFNVFRRDKGDHVHAATGAASTTGDFCVLLHGLLLDSQELLMNIGPAGWGIQEMVTDRFGDVNGIILWAYPDGSR